jgi:hypothetical protein
MDSPQARALVYHLVPVPARTHWTMSIDPFGVDKTIFTCIVEFDLPPALRTPARLTGLDRAVGRHAAEETAGFAADINRKFAAGGPLRADRVTRAAA